MLQAQNVNLLRESSNVTLGIRESSNVTIGIQQPSPMLAQEKIAEELELGFTSAAESNGRKRESVHTLASYDMDSSKRSSEFSGHHTRTLEESIVNRPTVQERVTILATYAENASPTPPRRTTIHKIQSYLQSSSFDILVSLVLFANALFMAVELQLEGLRVGFTISFYEEPIITSDAWSMAEPWIQALDIAFMCVFAADVAVRILFLGRAFWKSCLNWLDVLVVAASIGFILFKNHDFPVPPVLLRFVRLLKLVRTFRMIALASSCDSLSLIIKCLMSSVSVLGWSTCLVVFCQAICGMIISNIVQDYFVSSADEETRRHVWKYWGTFGRSFLTMFEVLFANFAPPCRALLDNVSEWIAIFLILARCSAGFALLNVMNSVFISQTLKNAGDDEQFLIKQQAMEMNQMTAKLEQVFRLADASNDGLVSLEEFKGMLEDTRMRLWLKQLQLEHADLMELFELIDDGDGFISWPEFMHGATRLKGNAKGSDLFRLETKIDTVLKAAVFGHDRHTREPLTPAS